MSLWFKARRCGWLLAVVAISVALVAVLGNVLVPVPAVLSLQGLSLPFALLIPLAPCVVLGYALGAGDEALEAVAARRIGLLDVAFVATTTLIAVTAFFAIEVAGWSQLGQVAGRNSVGFTGLLVLGRTFLGSNAGAVIPAMAALLTAFFGGDPAGAPRSWAWIVQPGTDARSWQIAAGLLVAGLIVWLLAGRMKTAR